MSKITDKSLEEITEIRAVARSSQMETFNAIKEYYMGSDPVILSPTREEIRQRWHTVYIMKMDRKSDQAIANSIKMLYKISQSQAYQDIANSKKLFGNSNKSDRDLNRQIAEQMAIETYELAKQVRNTKDMAAANKSFIDASGLKDDLSELPDFSKLESNIYVVMVDPRTEKLMEMLLNKPTINLSELMDEVEGEEIDYVEE